MACHTSGPALTVLMLVLATGAAAPAFAQRESPLPLTRQHAATATTVDFRSSDWLRDCKVVNDNGEDIAAVSDLILDRGSGRIEYLVITTDAILGFGGRDVAIPYGAFRWDTGEDRFLLGSTSEQLEQFPEFSPESWKAMKKAARDDKSPLRKRLTTDAAAPSDPYALSINTAEQVRIEGEITQVERVRTSTFGEQVMITVVSAKGTSQKIALGPSWFVNSSSAAPMRGDKVVVETLTMPRDPEHLVAATSLRTGDRTLHLRDTDGSAAWTLETVKSDGGDYSTPYSRYLLLSTLPGMTIDARGNDCGKVNDIILDRNSGEIGFLSIDPNQNFLGIADTKRLVPWTVATVTVNGIVRIDASKEMILASPVTPSDLSTLNTGTTARIAYEAYKVPAPHYAARDQVPAGTLAVDRDWSNQGSIIRAIQPDSLKTMAGKVVDVSEIKLGKGILPAHALTIRMPGDAAQEEIVLIGPAWYMTNQDSMCKTGDSVKVEACRTTIDGRQYWIARSIEAQGRSVVLIDADDAPVWDRR